ncbi:MAG: AbrB family transcriptional regulator [Beijerinckiaceae bacterium]|nr:AbrB family transcriptional regulator [Beijerinckiaceae bacterium]
MPSDRSAPVRAIAEDAGLLAVAGLGGLALHLAGVPAGWLTGAMLVVALVALRRPWKGPSNLTINAGMVLSGALLGASATPEAVAAAARYPGSLGLLLASLLATVLLTGAFLMRFGRWSRLDALLASAPGALSAVMVMARESGSNLAQVAVIQFFRLFVLVAAIPGALVAAGIGSSGAGGFVLAEPSWHDAGIMVLTGVGAGLAFARLGVVAPYILGSTVASMLLHATGLVHGALPQPLAVLAFLIIGGMIGTRLGGLDRQALSRLLPLAIGAFFVSVGIAALLAWPAAQIAKVSYGAAFIAFAPGGLEAMTMLALLLGLDPLYVGVHHLARFMAVGFLLPVFVRLVLPPANRP